MNATDMAPLKDQAIKLFGRKIPVPDTQMPANPESKDSCSEIMILERESSREDYSEELNKSAAPVQGKDENQTKVQLNEGQVISEGEKDIAENGGTDQEKVLKKPDKVLPCPRCNSMETKFCYFNNYNVNQPRHFCKNCQRYWTAGGTMRNVPIGAGRRKNKHFASQYRQILVSSDGIPITSMENSDSASHQPVSPTESTTSLTPPSGNGMVLKFGPEAPLCKSMETVLNLGDQKRCANMNSVGPRENGEEPSSSGSSMTASSNRLSESREDTTQKEQISLLKSSNELSSPNPLQLHSVTPLVFPWNPGWNNVASVAAKCSSGQASVVNGNSPSQSPWCPPVLAVPGFCPPNIPFQFIPASYWGCVPVWTAGTGNISLSGSNGCLSPSSSTSASSCPANGSPTLGKHSRDSNFPEEDNSENCVFVPKTLRIHNPDEASKCSLWATLGLKPDQKDPIANGTKYKNVETTGQGSGHVSEGTHTLETNPAALSCSSTWQGRS